MADAPTRKLISLIIPVFNEEENIPSTMQRLSAVARSLPQYDFEFVITDNCSTDATFALLRDISAASPAVKVARFARNFGFQKSILTGYRLCKGDAAIQIDADLQDPPELINEMLALWESGHDVVVGVRVARREPWLLQAMRKAYYQILARLTDENLVPNGGDFRLVDRSIIDYLKVVDDAMPYVRGLTSSLARNQATVPVSRSARAFGKSKYPLRRLFFFALDGFVAHTRLPLRISFFVGMAVALVSVLLSSFYLFARLIAGSSWPMGFATTQILILFGISINALFLGIIGEYVGRIYEQTRKRPTTIIAESLNLGPEELVRLRTI